MSLSPLRVLTSSCVLMVAGGLAADAQSPGSRRTTSAVEQLGLTDRAVPAVIAGTTRELWCRGKVGIALRVQQDPSPRQPKLVAMELRYDLPERKRSFGQEGMGLVDYGVTIQSSPGACTWNPGGFAGIPPEPGVVYFDLERDGQSWASPKARDTTIGAAANFPDVPSLTRYLSDPDRYWVFYVDDVTNVAISFGAWPRGGGLPPPSTDGGSHSANPAGGFGGPVGDASHERAGSGHPLPAVAVDSARPSDTTRVSGEAPPTAGAKRPAVARRTRQGMLATGIWRVTVAPGRRGVKLGFQSKQGSRAWVQFSQKPPRWNEREGRWAYPDGWGSPWYAEIRHPFGATDYEAVPMSDLEPGVRYHYLITVQEKDASSPTGQRIGTFTATVEP